MHHWYYILEMGFYVSLLLSVSVDVKRKVSVSHISLLHEVVDLTLGKSS